MGNTKTKLENDYLSFSKKKLRLYYRELYKNPINTHMSLEKKYFDKIVSIRSNSLLSMEKLKAVSWKRYMINYFERKAKEQKLNWYNELAIEVEKEIFFSEKKYTSCAFYKDFDLKNKPSILDNLCVFNNEYNTDYEEKLINKLSNNLFKEDEKNDLNMSKINLNTSNNDNIRVTVNSFMNDSFNPNELDQDIINVRKRVKEIIKIFKEHLTHKDHPIFILIQIFEKKISNIIKDKIIYFSNFNDKNNNDYKNNLKNTCDDIILHINNFIIHTQTAMKLMYSKAIDFECFYQEKDESINVISKVLFNTGKLYQNLYKLFSLYLNDEIINFAKILLIAQKLTPKDLKIPNKFSLDEETQKLKEELIEQKKLTSNIIINTNNLKMNEENYFKNSVEKIHKLKYIKVPYEKMMKLSSITNSITKSVNDFWKGMEKIITPNFLNITADELLVILIYIIIKANYPQILIHEYLIYSFTTKNTQSTTIGYFNTSIKASIDYIIKDIIKEYKLEDEFNNVQIDNFIVNDLENENKEFNDIKSNDSNIKTNVSIET